MTKQRIIRRVKQLEADNNVRVLFACESGSRVWGIASQNSDYDVRGVFIHPRDEYLRLDSPANEIHFIEDDLDFQLWDIYKYFGLERRSNPSALEWACSPVVYIEAPEALQMHWQRMRLEHWWNMQALIHHYRGLGHGEWRRYIESKPFISYKKYLYVVRPLIMVEWLRRFTSLPHTLNLPALMAQTAGYRDDNWLPADVLAAIYTLIDLKRQGSEETEGNRNAALDAWVQREFARIEALRSEWDVAPTFDRRAYAGETDLTVGALLRKYASVI